MDTITFYANLLPYKINIALSFNPLQTISDIHFFIEETFKSFHIPYEISHIKFHNVWLLPHYLIQDYITNKDIITIYSMDYNIKNDTIDNEYKVNNIDIDQLFIEKVTNRKSLMRKKINETIRTNKANQSLKCSKTTTAKTRTNSLLNRMKESVRLLEELEMQNGNGIIQGRKNESDNPSSDETISITL